MTDLEMDADAVRSAGSALTNAGWALPMKTDLAMGACGSSRVSATADDWAMWAKTSLMLLQGKTTDAGRSATNAANTFAAQEQELANAAAPTGP